MSVEKNLETLSIVSYDDSFIEHRKFKRELLSDDLFKEYFGAMFIKNADDIFTSSNELETKKAYLVKDLDEIVGMFRIFSYHQSGVINIQYAVRPSFRKKGYGSRILKELSNFLIQNNIRCIEGSIDKNNISSLKIATSLGYEKEENKFRLRR